MDMNSLIKFAFDNHETTNDVKYIFCEESELIVVQNQDTSELLVLSCS
jgi:hypothetical protein